MKSTFLILIAIFHSLLSVATHIEDIAKQQKGKKEEVNATDPAPQFICVKQSPHIIKSGVVVSTALRCSVTCLRLLKSQLSSAACLAGKLLGRVGCGPVHFLATVCRSCVCPAQFGLWGSIIAR